jgi:hypothetical protein
VGIFDEITSFWVVLKLVFMEYLVWNMLGHHYIVSHRPTDRVNNLCVLNRIFTPLNASMDRSNTPLPEPTSYTFEICSMLSKTNENKDFIRSVRSCGPMGTGGKQ